MADNYDLWEEHEREREAWLNRRPICAECGEHIQDDVCYRIGEELICLDCLQENHRENTEEV